MCGGKKEDGLTGKDEWTEKKHIAGKEIVLSIVDNGRKERKRIGQRGMTGRWMMRCSIVGNCEIG